ncbi:hypothetical protein [uncultured Aquimarina sp.]|uniref:hypothetical protein n=1 Tax=uncultured Aquimarina sp. TaxID=575652 RepID=UPI002607DFE5|nr:hypothetical protein [uncultured Aquimarina sp.]
MKKYKTKPLRMTHKYVLMSIICSFLLCTHNISAQGPNAPEAAAFEPVDATDMVNLVTGDMSYVLPLLNVPSPEGGYPLALSYHAGIAMDQEASWVGLGWNLNPGAINRNINEIPDDWNDKSFTKFFYNIGVVEDSYSVSASVNLYNTVSVGLGVSWGSHRSTGGYVSLGLMQEGLGQANVTIGTGGNYSIGVTGSNGLGVNLGSNGLGVGLSTSYFDFNFTKSGFSGSGSMGKSTSIGISFDSTSNSITPKASIGGGNFGMSSSNYNYNNSKGQYSSILKDRNIDIPLYYFNIGFSHRKVRHYSFNESKLFASGILNTYSSNEVRNGSEIGLIEDNSQMDVTEIPAYSSKQMSVSDILDTDYLYNNNNLIFPAADNYVVNSQGISGAIKPSSYFDEQIVLSGASNYKANEYQVLNFNERTTNPEWYFYFDNEYSSFSRIEHTNYQFSNSDHLYDLMTTQNSGRYSTSNNTTNKRKTTGNFIQTYKNSAIISSSIPNFIDAKEFENRGEYPNSGIGAFAITSIDGKTYHYSLPVYNFEMFSKNFKDKDNEDSNFLEEQRTEPYATHWLLTAITGPDYVDINNNNLIDEDDYGYWVEFEYGKWSDGFGWRGPSLDYETVKGTRINDETHSYFWGRKQIYYLDAIKTRTHTAHFVKGLRSDYQSSEITKFKEKHNPSEPFDLTRHGKEFVRGGGSNDWIGINWYNSYSSDNQLHNVRGYFSNYVGNSRYIDIPKNRSLKLEKIIVLKNSENQLINKTNGSGLISSGSGKFQITGVIKNIRNSLGKPYIDGKETLYRNRIEPNEFEFNLHQNVLDLTDITPEIELKALQILKFNYDYSLAKGAPNTVSQNLGRLTLKKLQVYGKKGKTSIPPYKFEYEKPDTHYNKEIEDVWGYHKQSPDAWSMNKIVTPTGGEINLQYEEDDYYAEAVNAKRYFTHGLSFYITSDNQFNTLYLEVTKNDHQNKVEQENFISFSDYYQVGQEVDIDLFLCRKGKYGSSRRKVTLDLDKTKGNVTYVSSNKTIISIPNNPSFWQFDDQTKEWILNRIWSLTDVTFNNGSPDGVIMRTPGADQCYRWRDHAYDNDDVSFNYLFSASKKINHNVGGGIRVKNISVSNGNHSLTSKYFYNQSEKPNQPIDPFDDNYISSGITSYAPTDDFVPIPYVSLIPSPLITYGNVIIENHDNNNTYIGSSSYKFNVLPEYEENTDTNIIFNLGDFLEIKKNQHSEQTIDHPTNNGRKINLKANKYTVYDRIANIGRIESVTNYNKLGQIMNEVKNEYKISGLDLNNAIGVTQNTYRTTKHLYDSESDTNSVLFSSASKIQYPSVLQQTITSQSGLTKIVNNDRYDYLTGKVLQTTISFNDDFKQPIFKEIIPAYQISDYYQMGSKNENINNKNMLTAIAVEKVGFIKPDNPIDGGSIIILDSQITTWNKNWTYRNYSGSINTPWQQDNSEKIWRKHQTFAWKGEVDEDGAYAGYTGDDDNFNWSDPDNQSNAEWIKTSEVSLYDHYSMPLESIDINGNKASTKMGDDNSKVFAVANASYTAMYYSGAEDLIGSSNFFSGEVAKGSTATLSDIYHTGAKAIQVSANVKAFSVLPPEAGNYKVSVWAYKGNNTNYTNTKLRAGSTTIAYYPTEVIPAGDWVQLNFYTNDIGANQEVYVYTTSGTVIYDDFRMVPIASSMSSYVYNEWDELTYIIGANNLATKYEYDDAGRLHKTYSEVMDTPEIRGGFKLNKEINYNYGNPTSNDTTNPNALTLSLGIGNPNVSTTTLTANANGGSYEYEYRFAIGTSSSNLSYGSWTSSNTRSLTTNCTSTGRRYYKCQVRDKNSGATKESTGNHQRGNCGIGDDDDPIDIIQQ